MKCESIVIFVCLFVAGCSDNTPQTDSPSPSSDQSVQDSSVPENQKSTGKDSGDQRAERLSELVESHNAAHKARNDAVRAAGKDAQQREVAHKAYLKQDFPQQFYDFALAADDHASLEACRYLISKFNLSELRHAAINHVAEYHLNKEGMDRFFMDLAHHYAIDPAADTCLKAGMSASSSATRAHATYQLALINLQRRDWCLDSADERAVYVDALGQEAVDHLLSDAGTDEIAGLLEQVISDYPDERFFDYSIRTRAEQSLFTLRNLEVGCEIPDVVGKDSAGRELKLRDQRGHIVVVCFWAHWCSVCMDSLPRETKFVESMKNRPFIWLGVNGDDDVELLRKAEAANTVNFRSWHDGQEGDIATQWNIWGFPALFVIDQNGIIRYKSRGHVDLDVVFPLVEKLTSSLESELANGVTND